MKIESCHLSIRSDSFFLLAGKYGLECKFLAPGKTDFSCSCWKLMLFNRFLILALKGISLLSKLIFFSETELLHHPPTLASGGNSYLEFNKIIPVGLAVCLLSVIICKLHCIMQSCIIYIKA